MPARRETTELAGEALRGGDPAQAARAALFERVMARLHRYFFRLVGPAHAEECTQEALLELQRSLHEAKYQAGRSFNTWAFLKAHKVFVAWCRAREKDERARAAHPPGSLAGPGEAAVDRRLDGQVILAELAARLGPETYECFVLRHEGALTLDEVAAASGCTRRTVSRRLERARELIQELLSEERP